MEKITSEGIEARFQTTSLFEEIKASGIWFHVWVWRYTSHTQIQIQLGSSVSDSLKITFDANEENYFDIIYQKLEEWWTTHLEEKLRGF